MASNWINSYLGYNFCFLFIPTQTIIQNGKAIAYFNCRLTKKQLLYSTTKRQGATSKIENIIMESSSFGAGVYLWNLFNN